MNRNPNEFTILIGERDNEGRVLDSACTQLWRSVLSITIMFIMIWLAVQSMITSNYWFHTDETTFSLSHSDRTLIGCTFITAAFTWSYLAWKYMIAVCEYESQII